MQYPPPMISDENDNRKCMVCGGKVWHNINFNIWACKQHAYLLESTADNMFQAFYLEATLEANK